MLFDARALLPAPGGGSGSDAIGEEAVDDAGQKISQVLRAGRYRKDLVLVSWIRNKGVDALVSMDEPGNNPQPKLLLRERVEHFFDRAEKIAAASTPRQDQDIRLRSIGLREIRIDAARLARRRACRDIRRPGGKRRQVVFPSDFRQENFHAHDPRERALDFHVKAGQDRNPTSVIAVL